MMVLQGQRSQNNGEQCDTWLRTRWHEVKLHRDCPRDCVSKFTPKKGQLAVPSCVVVLVSGQEVSRL